MKKVYVTFTVLIVIALVAGIIWMQQSGENDETANTSSPTAQDTETESEDVTQNEQNTEPEAADELTIVYDGSGFSPSTLTVSQGEIITFRNESSTQVQPASDDHPVHDELPGFDALQGLDQGEEYSFTFNEPGEWGYHNHLNPSQTGTIIVE